MIKILKQEKLKIKRQFSPIFNAPRGEFVILLTKKKSQFPKPAFVKNSAATIIKQIIIFC